MDSHHNSPRPTRPNCAGPLPSFKIVYIDRSLPHNEGMNRSISLYVLLALIWAGLAVAIFFGAHERLLGQAEEWKRYLAMGLCGLMCLWNIARILMLRQLQRPKPPVHDFTR